MPSTSPARLLLVYVVALATYAVTTRFGFVYDDSWTLVENAFIRDWRHLGELFSARYFATVPDANRPLMLISLMVDYTIHGLHPGGYHLQSMLWHAAASLLVLSQLL